MKKLFVLFLIAVFSVSSFSCQAKSPKEKAADAFYAEAKDFLKDAKKMADAAGEDELVKEFEKEIGLIEKKEISVESLADDVSGVLFLFAFSNLSDSQMAKLDSVYEKLDGLYKAYKEAPEE